MFVELPALIRGCRPTREGALPCYVDFDKAESQSISLVKSLQQARGSTRTQYPWRFSCRGGLLVGSGSALLNWIEGPIRNIQFSNLFRITTSTTSNLLFGNLQHQTEAGWVPVHGFRRGRTKLLTRVELQQGEYRSRPPLVSVERS